MDNTLGLYLHIPFCESKCHYCNFYSSKQDEKTRQHYVTALQTHLSLWSEKLKDKKVDSLYFGGGTPSTLTPMQLCEILATMKGRFHVSADCEITLEANPEHLSGSYCKAIKELGVNRVSVGMQSCWDKTLHLIGRRHTAEDVSNAVNNLKGAGIHNISLDIIAGLPGEGEEELKASINFALAKDIPHLSFYLLKVEPGTFFHTHRGQFTFPDDDTLADLYLFAANCIEHAGLPQYEISNFAKVGFQSRHNLKYWQLKDYLGVGPSAHSMVGSKRFYYPGDLPGFLASANLDIVTQDDTVDPTEYLLLSLRLKTGFSIKRARTEFSLEILPLFYKTVAALQKNGLALFDGDTLTLTKEGFLVSNSVITALSDSVLPRR